ATLLLTWVAPAHAAPEVRLRRVAGVDTPTAMATREGDDTLSVAERGAHVVAVVDGRVRREPVLDLGDRVSFDGEQGLLGLAFSPDGERLYVHFSDRDGDTLVEEYAFTEGA